MYIFVIFMPLVSYLLVALFGNFLGRKGSVIITTTFLFFSFFLSLIIFYEIVLSHTIVLINLFT
jgi:NADH:ubiquinone oxidoreductase subunit 5 (subunit L)/multisubunit Na+/H+ antiporter MnhA subunit